MAWREKFTSDTITRLLDANQAGIIPGDIVLSVIDEAIMQTLDEIQAMGRNPLDVLPIVHTEEIDAIKNGKWGTW